MTLEYKTAFEESNKIMEAKFAKVDADFATERAAKEALEAKFAAFEAASARPALVKNHVVDEYKSALEAFFRNPKDTEVKSRLKALETKAMSAGNGPAGGFTVPTEILAGIQNVKFAVSPIRRLAEVISANTPNVSKVVEVSGFGYEWLSETGVRNETATPVYESRVPTFGILAAKAPISLNLIDDSTFDVIAEAYSGFAKSFAKGESVAFISGNGTDQPTGLLNGTTVGNIPSGNATSFTSADIFLDLINAVDSTYHAGAVFLMNTRTKAAIAKLKNTEGDSIVRDSVIIGYPSTLWGFPIEIDENMPNIAAGAFPVLFGNLYDGYLVADRGLMSIMEDPFTNYAYVNYVGRKRVGGIVKDARALKKLRIAVS